MPRLASYAVWLVVAGAAATGCSAATDSAPPPVDSSGQPSQGSLSAPELDDPEGDGADSGAPRLEGRRAVTVGAARREVVSEPCTANQIERLCAADFTIEPVGEPEQLTLTGATTRAEQSGLTWLVRLEFAAPGTPLPRAPGELTLLLEAAGGLQQEIGEGATVRDRAVVLSGLDKRNAWSLVERLADR